VLHRRGDHHDTDPGSHTASAAAQERGAQLAVDEIPNGQTQFGVEGHGKVAPMDLGPLSGWVFGQWRK